MITQDDFDLWKGPRPVIDHAEIDNRFAFHPATTEEKRNEHGSVRQACASLGHFIVARTPPGREQSLALTKLEETMHWANAAIALPQRLIGRPALSLVDHPLILRGDGLQPMRNGWVGALSVSCGLGLTPHRIW